MVRAIIVDDDETDSYLIETAIRHFLPNLSIVRVNSVLSALDAIFENGIAARQETIIITDLIMPETEGVALIRWATTFLNIQRENVVALSSTTDKKLRKQAAEAGAAMVLAKPESYGDLLDVARCITHSVRMLAA